MEVADVPRVLDPFFRSPDPDALEAELPEYVPYLGGSRYSFERLKAGLDDLTLETTREDLLLSLVRGNATSGRLPGSGHVPSGVTQEAIS